MRLRQDLLSKESWEIWLGEFPASRPFPLDATTLFIAFNASAEVRTFKALGWPAPARVLDLFAEYLRPPQRPRRRNRPQSAGGAGVFRPGYSIGTVYKKQMIDRILKGPPFTEEERREILDYCWSDVYALERLLPAMLPDIDWKGALLRGRYAYAVAAMETPEFPSTSRCSTKSSPAGPKSRAA